MGKSNDVKNNFSALLRDCLRNRYGRIPSAAVVAREFNLRAYDTTPISQESARRWIRGVSLPEEERLRILVEWLDLDFNEALRAKSCYPRPRFLTGLSPVEKNSSLNGYQAGHPPNGHGNGQYTVDSESRKSQDENLNLDEEFMRLILALNEHQRRAITELIRTTFSTQRPQ